MAMGSHGGGVPLRVDALLLLSVIVAVVVPWLLPTQRLAHFQRDLVRKVGTHQLTDSLNAGMFKRSPMSGDTSPSWQATFWGVSALSKATNDFVAAARTPRSPGVREARVV